MTKRLISAAAGPTAFAAGKAATRRDCQPVEITARETGRSVHMLQGAGGDPGGDEASG
ncbi:MAG: hypothetical protein ACFB00_10045 [Parvularculaceae bacterium]